MRGDSTGEARGEVERGEEMTGEVERENERAMGSGMEAVMEMAMGADDVEIVKARTDKREYRRVVLSNALEVLLISDPDTDKAAACMDVMVGSFCEPDGLEGLAHFLEHMLFYASEKYPVEDSYSKYITEHGGSTNAFTGSLNTVFYFDVNVDAFEEALDRFSQFFVKPLISSDATLREIKAVDSENQKNLLSDSWRMDQLQRHLSSRDHPYHKFSTGNWNTLEAIPKANGLDTRNELIKFYKQNYSANLMHLVVYGKESLDDIQNLVEMKFQDIPNIGRSHFHFSGQPCSSEHLQILVKAVRIRERDILRIVWPITPSINHYTEGPSMYITHLIGHEGEGSVFSVLKKLGWAMSVVAGEDDWNFAFSFFYVTIELTDEGHEHVEEIVGLLFRYILLLQNSGINKWIFDELVAICENGFHYQDKVPPIDYVVHVASNMQLYPPKDWLVASSLPSKFDPGTIQIFLDQLSQDNVRIFCESKKFEGHTELIEPWYGTSYSVEKVAGSMIQQWMEKTPGEDLHLPAPNVFIPSDLTIKPVQDQVKSPLLLRESSYSKLWYKPDTMFFIPKAYIIIDFNCPQLCRSPEAEVLTEIFTQLLVDYLNEYGYDALVAGLSYWIYHTGTGFQIVVAGYNHKMRILLETIIGKVAHFEVKADRFSVIKENVKKGYENFRFQQPSDQASYYCSLLLSDQSWPLSEKLEMLHHLEANDLAKFSPQLLSKTFLECYVAGNVEPSEAESIVKHIEEVLFVGQQPISKPLFPSEHLAYRTVKLKKGVTFYYPIEVLNQRDENSSLVHYIQAHPDDIKLNVKLQLFVLIAKQAAFHQLRTVEQLGYITSLSRRSDAGIRGMQFIIQSTVKDPAELDARVQAFLETFERKLYEISGEEYKSNVNALIDLKLEKYKNLWEESAFFWGEIANGTLKFERIESEVAALRELTQQELIDFFNTYVKVGAPRRRALSVQVYGGLHSKQYAAAKSGSSGPQKNMIEDICCFRRSRPLYKSFK